MGISASQWRHSSSPPPEGYECIPADEQGTAEAFMEGFLLNPNSIRPIRKPSAD
ncbi:hypothetical protein BD626DRAFT_476337 [Schizophyllum amplum]|uniref:Uncharacterized protein n=1 Tax=Schizophyllum amplum TaxID=97359 RepID=A0A550CZB7_9AGAR|nr:hypothetical protein BD626DRAFT_476337 [Auriculariopsis ampla]